MICSLAHTQNLGIMLLLFSSALKTHADPARALFFLVRCPEETERDQQELDGHPQEQPEDDAVADAEGEGHGDHRHKGWHGLLEPNGYAPVSGLPVFRSPFSDPPLKVTHF